MTGDGATVSLTVEDSVAMLVLNRPDTGNAISMSMARELLATLEVVRVDPAVRVLVIEGAGRMFCAGGDVREMAAALSRTSFLAELAEVVHAFLARLRALPVPVVAVVRGTAAGAGLGLVLAADIVLSSDDATYLAAYTNVGLSPDSGVTALLPLIVGPRRAAMLALTPKVLTADEAWQWGIVSEVCAPGQLRARRDELAALLASGPYEARGATALLLRDAVTTGYAARLADEARTITRIAATDAAGELIDRFARGRRPG